MGDTELEGERLMKRLYWVIAVAAVTLTAAGIAVASLRGADAQAVSATFSANAESMRTWTCTNATGTQVVHGRYVGSATSTDTRLNGPLRLDLRSSYDSVDGIGYVRGTVRFSRGSDDGSGWAHLYAVNKGGKLEGVLVGVLGGRPRALIANVSADFSSTAISNGKLGGGGGDNTAVVYGGTCKRKPVRPAVKHIVLVRRGKVEALSTSSVTIKPETGDAVTCTITSGQSQRITRAGIAVGTDVQAHCVRVSDAYKLVSIRKR